MTTGTAPVLPSGVSEGSFSQALDRFAAVLGSEHVQTGQALANYRDPYSFSPQGSFEPSAVLAPASVEEVQALVAVANEHHIPLWTVSMGRNYGYGGASPRVTGSIVVALHRMNRVLEVDDECGYAIVEPGVRFSDLYDHLRSTGSTLWVSVPDLSWGSVLGNTLERGFGYTPHGDHSVVQCGMEVVLADGRVVRTGMGAMAGNNAWALYKGGFGPSLDGLFLQSNLGIVTKIGVWLMPRPEQVAVAMAKAPEEHQLGEVIDTLRPLLLDGTIQSNSVVGNALAIASMISDRQTWYDGPGAMPDDAIRHVTQGLGIGWWNARFAVYGTEDLVTARMKAARAAFSRVPGLELDVRSYPGDATADQVHPADRAQMGVPSTDLIRMAGWRGGEPAHTDFSLVCPPRSSDAITQMRLVRSRVESYGFDYAGGFTTFPHHAIALALISFDRSSPQQVSDVATLFLQLVDDAAAQGYAPYRSHLAEMDHIASKYDFNDHALMRLTETIKDAVDPAGILSPGKQGIWPAHLRQR